MSSCMPVFRGSASSKTQRKGGRDGMWRVQGEKWSKVKVGNAEERLISNLIVMVDNMIPSVGWG